MPSLPSKYDVKCAGISFLTGQILILIGAPLYSGINVDIYDVHNDEQVIELHNVLSSSEHRRNVEIAVTLTWISFPLLLMSIFTMTKFFQSFLEGTSAEKFIYFMEKAYLMYLLILGIVYPALSLTSVSFEWSFNEYTSEPDIVPTGYYIQLYIATLSWELIDCVAIVDAIFLLSLFIIGRIIYFGSLNNPKLKQYRSVMESQKTQKYKCCMEFCLIICTLILFIVFCFILFEFAKSGFFSPSGPTKTLVIVSFIAKFIIGIKFIVLAFSKKYDRLQEIIDAQNNDNDGQKMLAVNVDVENENYTMDTINDANDDDQL